MEWCVLTTAPLYLGMRWDHNEYMGVTCVPKSWYKYILKLWFNRILCWILSTVKICQNKRKLTMASDIYIMIIIQKSQLCHSLAVLLLRWSTFYHCQGWGCPFLWDRVSGCLGTHYVGQRSTAPVPGVLGLKASATNARFVLFSKKSFCCVAQAGLPDPPASASGAARNAGAGHITTVPHPDCSCEQADNPPWGPGNLGCKA